MRWPAAVGALAALAPLAACGGASGPPAKPPAVVTEDPGSVRSTPPPAIAWGDGSRLDLHGLPAIAAAGEVVVFAVGDGSAAHIEVRAADDRLVRTLAIPAAAGGPTTASAVDATNHELAILHGVHDLHPMHAVPVEAGHDGEDQHWATGDNLDVEWRERHLRVFRHNSTQALVDLDGARWANAGACPASAFLGAIYHAVPGTVREAAGNTILVTIGSRTTETCPAPEPRVHVISWVGAAR